MKQSAVTFTIIVTVLTAVICADSPDPIHEKTNVNELEDHHKRSVVRDEIQENLNNNPNEKNVAKVEENHGFVSEVILGQILRGSGSVHSNKCRDDLAVLVSGVRQRQRWAIESECCSGGPQNI